MTSTSDGLSRRLVRWGVSSSIADRLSRRHSTLFDLLALTPVELQSATNRNLEHNRRHIIDVIAAKRAPVFRSASRLAAEVKDSSALPLRTSLKEVDEALAGGLPRGSITEIVGPPGAGKTQFCLMMAAVTAAAVEGLRNVESSSSASPSSVAYIDTEGAFSPTRMFEIAREKFPELYRAEDNNRVSLKCRVGERDWRKELGERVMVYYSPTSDKLSATLEVLDIDIVKYGFDLVVLDSIASVVRKEFHGGQTETLIDRAKLLAKEAKSLKELAKHHNIPILVTNQITTHYQAQRNSREIEPLEDEEEVAEEEGEEAYREEPRGVVTAALGNSWSHFVNTRIALDFEVDGNVDDDAVGNVDRHFVTSRRTLKLLKSPFAPQMKLSYALTASGPVLLSPPECVKKPSLRFTTKSAVVKALS